jgi:hypothetical protein
MLHIAGSVTLNLKAGSEDITRHASQVDNAINHVPLHIGLQVRLPLGIADIVYIN